MATLTIYSPQVIAHARAHAVTELQALRHLRAKEELAREARRVTRLGSFMAGLPWT